MCQPLLRQGVNIYLDKPVTCQLYLGQASRVLQHNLLLYLKRKRQEVV